MVHNSGFALLALPLAFATSVWAGEPESSNPPTPCALLSAAFSGSLVDPPADSKPSITPEHAARSACMGRATTRFSGRLTHLSSIAYESRQHGDTWLACGCGTSWVAPPMSKRLSNPEYRSEPFQGALCLIISADTGGIQSVWGTPEDQQLRAICRGFSSH